MKRLALLLLFLPLGSQLQTTPPPAEEVARVVGVDEEGMRMLQNDAFEVGEYLKYRIHYGLVNAGIAELRVLEETRVHGRPTYHIVGSGGSVGMFNLFYKVDDRYETYLDRSALVPWKFIRDVYEGGYEINREIDFDHYVDSAYSSNGKSYATPENVQDLLSAFYYSRTFDVDGIQVGDELEITTFLDHEVFPLRLRYIGDDLVKTKFGKVECMKFQPIVLVGRVFKEAEGMYLWATKDENHVPVRLQSELLFGSIKMDMIDYDGVRRPIDFQ